MNTAEQLEQEADDLLRRHYAPEAAENTAGADTAPPPAAPATNTDQQGFESGEAQAPLGEAHDPTGDRWEERYKNAQALMTRATQEAAQLRAQINELLRRNDLLQGEVERLKAQGPSSHPAPPARGQDTAPEVIDDTDLQQAIAEDPALATPLVKHIRKLNQELTAVQRSMSSSAEQQAQRDHQARYQEHMARVYSAHPDVEQITRNADFHGWVQRQTPMVRQAVAQGTAEDAIWVLNQYKAAAGIPTNLDEARAAATPNTPRVRRQPLETRPKFTRAEIAAMSPAEFSRREAEIDAAMVAGLIV
jgi:hypothetical protein